MGYKIRITFKTIFFKIDYNFSVIILIILFYANDMIKNLYYCVIQFICTALNLWKARKSE